MTALGAFAKGFHICYFIWSLPGRCQVGKEGIISKGDSQNI